MGTATAPRVLLDSDTLHIGVHGQGKAPYPEDIPPPAVLRAIAQHLRIDLNTQGVFWGDYCYFAGVSGEAFRFLDLINLKKPDPVPTLAEQYGQMSDEQMYRIALQSAGLGAEVYLKPKWPQRAMLQQRIVQSLRDRQIPVIGFGVFGPPVPFLITGYDEGGEVLLGRAHFQGEKRDDPDITTEPKGQFRLRNWYAKADGFVIVTGRQERPALKEIYDSALRRAVRELRVTGTADQPLGTAAIEHWAKYLEADANIAGLSAEQLKKVHEHHQVVSGEMAERRALAASFAELAAGEFPEAKDDLARAQAVFMGAHDTIYEIWETVANTGPFDPDLEKFRDPARRRTLAALVRRLVQLDQRGAMFLEDAVSRIDGKAVRAVAEDPLLDGMVVLAKAAVVEPRPRPIWAPENIHLPNAMGMLRAFLGEPFAEPNDAEKANAKLDYVLWMGLSGAAFGMLHDGPERANLPLVFDALGYDYELWMSGRLAKDTGLPCKVWGWDDNLRRRIFWNLRDRRLPVLLFNCGQWPDWYLVTQAANWGEFRGYGGNSGEGYRPNEPLDDPKNPLRKIDLFAGMKGKETWTISLTAKRSTAKPPMEELYARAIEWGAGKMQRQEMKLLDANGNQLMSSRPYLVWAAMMRNDALFPPDPEVLKQRRRWLEGDEVELCERRHYGAGFLALAAQRLKRPELSQAAEHFRAVAKRVEQIWAGVGGLGAEQAHLKLGDRQTRETVAQLLLEIEQEDAAAAKVLGSNANH